MTDARDTTSPRDPSRTAHATARERLFLSMMALGATLLPGCRHEAPPETAAVPVRVMALNAAERPDTVAASGSIVSPAAPTELAFLVAGRVASVGPREGDLVSAGQVLATLEGSSYAFAADAAAAQVGAARVAAARAADEHARMKQLLETRSIAPNDFLKFEAARDATRQQLEQALAAERIARKNLADTTLVTPVAGFVSRRSLEPGDMAAAGSPAFEIVQLDPVEITIGVPEKDIGRVRADQPACVIVPALDRATFEGRVRVVNVAADPVTRTFMARIVVPNPDHRLKVGMIAEVQVTGDRPVRVLNVPVDAIVRDPQGASLAFVYYPDQGKAYSHRVETGAVTGGAVEITTGLAEGDAVVVAGQQRLRDGMKVEVLP